jgi:hypothetical protein
LVYTKLIKKIIKLNQPIVDRVDEQNFSIVRIGARPVKVDLHFRTDWCTPVL